MSEVKLGEVALLQVHGDQVKRIGRMRAFNLNDFKQLFEEAEVDLLDIFGDYKLSKFDANESSRLIMIFK